MGRGTGLQLAIRTDRLTAFVAGGFPMVNGPYAEMLRITRTLEAGPAKLFGNEAPYQPESARQFTTFYEGLRTFDDRAAQSKVRCPRLNFIGTADDVTLNGELLTRMGETVARHRAELEGFGWEVQLLEGLNHMEAVASGIAIPIVRQWLARRAGD